MDLDDTQRYAAAALFTTLLHSKQLEAGVAGDAEAVKANYNPWGEPSSSQQFTPASTEQSAGAYWGYDCTATGGLCERIYQHLQVPQSKWAALKQLPQVLPSNLVSVPFSDAIACLICCRAGVLDADTDSTVGFG